MGYKLQIMNCKKKLINQPILCFITFACLIYFISSCSQETTTYDDLETSGKVESTVRKKYREFFNATKQLNNIQETSSEALPDSVLLKKSAILTDRLIEGMRPFPDTFESRIALDALSYAAHDLTVSPGFSQGEVYAFWKNGLLDPIFTKGRAYIKSEKINRSTHYQIVKAIQRGIGTETTNDMLMDLILIVGIAPSEEVMELCSSDSLVFKKIYDLIVYTRSLQKIAPPMWMITGSWFLAVDIEGLPLHFFCLKPLLVENSLFLTFKDYPQGGVYSKIFNDPIPSDTSQTDSWLSRAGAVMDSLMFDDAFADMVSTSGLPTYDTHNFFNDYILITKADSIKKEFKLVFKREKVEENAFQFAGVDSIEVLFTMKEIISRADTITPLLTTRYHGDTMLGGQFIPAKKYEGMAFLMPMGIHDENILKKFRESKLPEITISAP